MERYIEQLIEDMQEAAQHVKPPGTMWQSVDMSNKGEVEDMAFVEQYIYGTPAPLSSIVGITSEKLPPTDRLTEAQAKKLYAAMEKLLKAHRFVPDFPDGLPVTMKYAILRDSWNDEHVAIGAGEVHIEFCEYEPEECPFPERYCSCKVIQEEIEREEREGPKYEGPDLDADDLLPL